MSDTDLPGLHPAAPRSSWACRRKSWPPRMGYRSKSSITKLEKGINDLPRAKLEELAAALNTTPAWLMGLVDAAQPAAGLRAAARDGAGARL